MYLLFAFVLKLKKRQIKGIWIKEQRLAITKRYYEEHISVGSLANEYDAVRGRCRVE